MFKPKAKTLTTLFALVALALPIYAAAADQLPLKAAESGTFQLAGPCDTNGVIIDVTGTGHATDFGNYSVHYRECFLPATGTVMGGSFTLTAANGDTLYGTYTGQASPTGDPNVIAFDDPGLITGGSGRFAAATGRLNQNGIANLATGEYAATLTGSISRAASA